MWLSITLGFLVVFVIWVETGNASFKDIYDLEVWTRDPKYDVTRKASSSFRRVVNHNASWGPEDKAVRSRVRKPLKERIHERIHAGETRSHRNREGKTEKEDDDQNVSTRLTHMQLVTHPSTAAHKSKKGVSEEKDKRLADDKKTESDDETPEMLSVYSMKQSMNEIAKQLGKEANITIDVIGRTFEYNDIVILKMTEMKSEISKYFRAHDDAKYIDDAPAKKIIFIVHGLVIMGIRSLPCLSFQKQFMQLLNYYLEHLDKFDIFLIPMANPDGYTQSFHTFHWNKNTSPQASCQGVNLDRNFDVAWSEAGQVGPCSQNYPGPIAFSEPETKAVREVFHRYSHKIAAYIHVHGGTLTSKTFKGEALLYPKGFTETPSDDDKYMDMKGEIDEIMRNASFQRTMVTIDTLYRWYGKVTGTSVDYAATVFGIPFAMEFVMQSYDEEPFQDAALPAIWKRVIDAVFNFVYKKGETTNDV